MYFEILCEYIQKCKVVIDKFFGVNILLMYFEIDIFINMVIEEGVKIVFIFVGNLKIWIEYLYEYGIIVVYVVVSIKFVVKCEEVGVDVIVVEGFEVGGYNGWEEMIILCFILVVRQIIIVLLIVVGGIGLGESILVVMVLGVDGV